MSRSECACPQILHNLKPARRISLLVGGFSNQWKATHGVGLAIRVMTEEYFHVWQNAVTTTCTVTYCNAKV